MGNLKWILNGNLKWDTTALETVSVVLLTIII